MQNFRPAGSIAARQEMTHRAEAQIRATSSGRRQVLRVFHTQGLPPHRAFFLLAHVMHLTLRVSWGPIAQSFTCTFLVCSSCEDFFSLQKNQNDKKKPSWCRFFQGDLVQARGGDIGGPPRSLTTDSVFLHVRADTCIRDHSGILAIALRFLRSPVLRLVGVCGLAHARRDSHGVLLTGALARNIRRKEAGKPSDKHKNKSFNSMFPAREP